MMSRTGGLFFLISLFLLGSAAHAEDSLSSRLDSLIQKGIRFSITQSYEEAIALFESIEQNDPDNPAGYFFHAAVLQSRMMDYERYEQMPEFGQQIKKTIETAERKLRESDDDIRALFFLGGAYGYQAFQLGKQKKYLEAIRVGRRSIKVLSKVVELDSTFYDAYFAIGYYLYYRSKLTRYFSWLPFVENEKAKGIEMIRTALQRSEYSRYAAMNSLCWILIEEERYEEGLALADRALRSFPDSRVFLWCAAKLSMKMGQWEQAAGFYSRIIASLQNDNALFPYNELICRKNLARAYSQIGKAEQAHAECSKIQKLKFNGEDRRTHSDAIKEARQVCESFDDYARANEE